MDGISLVEKRSLSIAGAIDERLNGRKRLGAFTFFHTCWNEETRLESPLGRQLGIFLSATRFPSHLSHSPSFLFFLYFFFLLPWRFFLSSRGKSFSNPLCPLLFGESRPWAFLESRIETWISDRGIYHRARRFPSLFSIFTEKTPTLQRLLSTKRLNIRTVTVCVKNVAIATGSRTMIMMFVELRSETIYKHLFDLFLSPFFFFFGGDRSIRVVYTSKQCISQRGVLYFQDIPDARASVHNFRKHRES